eukprot:10332921-Alexandrium_andersonii.AAC.1
MMSGHCTHVHDARSCQLLRSEMQKPAPEHPDNYDRSGLSVAPIARLIQNIFWPGSNSHPRGA